MTPATKKDANVTNNTERDAAKMVKQQFFCKIEKRVMKKLVVKG